MTVELADVAQLFLAAITGAGVAWRANHIINSDLWGHVREQGRGIEAERKGNEERDVLLREHDRKLAVLWDEHEQARPRWGGGA